VIGKDLRYGFNMFRQYRDYLMRRANLKATPSIYWIDTVSQCNFRCPFCPTTYASKSNKGSMEFDLFKKIIDEVSSHSLENYLFQTGEPLVNQDIGHFVKYMTEIGMTSVMHTNGSLWTEEKAIELFDAGIDLISFSFDGYDSETYEKNRIGGKFQKTVNRIIGVLELKKKRGTRKPYIRIQSLTPSTADEKFSEQKQKEFMDLFEGLPVDEFDRETISNLAHDLPTGESLKPEAPMTMPEHIVRGYRFKPCTRLWSSMTIRFDGTVVPCCVDFESEVPLGNIKEKTLGEIWNGKPMQDLRKKHLSGDVSDIPFCKNCDFPYGLDVAGIPVGMAGNHSLVRKYLGYGFHRWLLRPLRFHGGRVKHADNHSK